MTIPKTLVSVCFITLFSTIAVAEAAEKSDPLRLARGAKAWAQNCGRCHNIRAPKELSDEEWEVSATHMRVRANLPGDMVRDIILFLQSSNNVKGEQK
ncbi:cytochrome c [Luteithermobacter gelatinilyticus]|uniref:cytochrome c n=1 Tax=Luteithermobacter gelatinilyticus TaxID=2582913 RepID=UPI001106B22D|nr:cytochrome c [Luteithermobacter gelatinilyticus]